MGAGMEERKRRRANFTKLSGKAKLSRVDGLTRIRTHVLEPAHTHNHTHSHTSTHTLTKPTIARRCSIFLLAAGFSNCQATISILRGGAWSGAGAGSGSDGRRRLMNRMAGERERRMGLVWHLRPHNEPIECNFRILLRIRRVRPSCGCGNSWQLYGRLTLLMSFPANFNWIAANGSRGRKYVERCLQRRNEAKI